MRTCTPGFARSNCSPPSLTLAPPEIRDRITIAETSDFAVAERAFDLVICREVFEHLTVLQVRESVGRICRASSRYVYVTTRKKDGRGTVHDCRVVVTERDGDICASDHYGVLADVQVVASNG